MASLQVLKKSKAATNIDVKIIEIIAEDMFIVADESESMIMRNIDGKIEGTLIQQGNSVRFIKPKYIDENLIEVNQNFRPMKIRPIEVNIKDKKIQKWKELANTFGSRPSSASLLTFSILDQKPQNSEACNLVFKACSVSRAIEGKFSKFKLATIKDVDNTRNNIAIYPPHLEKIVPGSIYKISVVKKTNYKKEDEDYFRLSTVRKSVIQEFEDKEDKFKNVTVGEFQVHGSILGHGDIMLYDACESSWMKVKETKRCDAHSEKKEECKKRTKFVTEIYVAIKEADGEVETFSAFSRHFNFNEQHLDEMEIQKKLEEIFISQMVSIEYNIDKDINGKKRIVKMILKH